MIKKAVVKIWKFRLDREICTTALFQDGSLKCDCPEWTEQFICNHIKTVYRGTADLKAISIHSFTDKDVKIKKESRSFLSNNLKRKITLK